MLINNLPPELLRYILAFLPSTTSDPFEADYSQLANALLVCKKWRNEGESPFLWKEAKLVIGSMERMTSLCEGYLPKRYALTKSLHVPHTVFGTGLLFMEVLPPPLLKMKEKLSSDDSAIVNLSFFPINMIDHTFLERLTLAMGTGEYDVFPIITPKMKEVKARMWQRDSMVHTTFLKEVIYKLETGKIRLEVLDLRGMEIPNTYGPFGRNNMRGRLQQTTIKILYDK